MTAAHNQRLLRWSAVLTLVGLALMLWSIFEPRAMPVVLAMSVGQGIGTLAFAMFGWVVLTDIRRTRALARRALARGVTVAEDSSSQPSASDAKPSASDAKPSASDAKPSVSDAKPSASDAKPSASDAKPAAEGNAP
jgi:hypothetical protein